MIQKQTATVYFSSEKGRRYLTLNAACSNEANELIYKKHPKIPFDNETGEWFDWKYSFDRADVFHRRVTRLVKAKYKQQSTQQG